MRLRHTFMTWLGLLSFLFGCGNDGDGPNAKGSGAFRFEKGQWRYEGSQVFSEHPASFRPLSQQYGKDKQQVFFGYTYRKGQEYFTVKHVSVDVLVGADAPSFTVLSEGMAKDKAHVYLNRTAHRVRDVASFELLGGPFARDRQRGYAGLTEIEGSDGPTFKAMDLRSNFARNAHAVYYASTETQQGAQHASRQIQVLPRAQSASFQLLEPVSGVGVRGDYARDAHRVYHRAQVLTQDVVRFAVLGHGYARSATQVWHEGRLLAGADAASFALTTAVPDVHIDATDVRAAYWLGERVKRTPPAISESIK